MNLVYKDTMPTISVHISFAFEPNTLFFSNVQCSFTAGSLTFIVGKNGIGKSTFFRILQGKIYQGERVSGSIIIDNVTYDFADKNTHNLLANKVRLVAQNYSTMLASDFSVAVNLGVAQLFCYPSVISLPTSFKYLDMLEEVGITLDKQAAELSGGQKQILAIIMALQKPIKFLLLDEPTAALDEKNTQLVMNFLTKLTQAHNITIICITHDKEVTHAFAQNFFYEIVKNNQGERYIEKR